MLGILSDNVSMTVYSLSSRSLLFLRCSTYCQKKRITIKVIMP